MTESKTYSLVLDEENCGERKQFSTLKQLKKEIYKMLDENTYEVQIKKRAVVCSSFDEDVINCL